MVGVSVADTTLGTLVANLGYDKLRLPQAGVRRRHAAQRKRSASTLRESKSRPERRHRHLGAPQLQPARRDWSAQCTRSALLLKKPRMSEPRSWLFVPADSEKKIAKALDSEADAIIFDLEDSVAPGAEGGRPRTSSRTSGRAPAGRNGGCGSTRSAASITRTTSTLLAIGRLRTASSCPRRKAAPTSSSWRTAPATSRSTPSSPKPPASLFGLLSYRDPKSPLVAMSWGAEDLPRRSAPSSKYDADGELSFTYKLARSLCLAGAVAAGVQPVDGVFADFRDDEGPARTKPRPPRREGFTGKLAIHPGQVGGDQRRLHARRAEDVAHAEAIVAAFEAEPDAGVLSVGGKMVDRPHLVQAKRVLERASR